MAPQVLYRTLRYHLRDIEHGDQNTRWIPKNFRGGRMKLSTCGKVVTNCDHLQKLKYSSQNPFAFTEYGVLMAANLLNSPRSIEMSIFIVRAFVKLRRIMTVGAHGRAPLRWKRSMMFSLRRCLMPYGIL